MDDAYLRYGRVSQTTRHSPGGPLEAHLTCAVTQHYAELKFRSLCIFDIAPKRCTNRTGPRSLRSPRWPARRRSSAYSRCSTVCPVARRSIAPPVPQRAAARAASAPGGAALWCSGAAPYIVILLRRVCGQHSFFLHLPLPRSILFLQTPASLGRSDHLWLKNAIPAAASTTSATSKPTAKGIRITSADLPVVVLCISLIPTMDR
jgi:hypothetical protein